MTRVAVSPDMLRWARERANLEIEDLTARFAKLPEWEAGNLQPTLKQLEKFAKAVYVPFGFLFLPEPPQENLPIPDFRTFESQRVVRPSPNLLDMIYACQERQSWYKEFSQINQIAPRAFVGRSTLSSRPEDVATDIRQTIGFNLQERAECSTSEDALRLFIRKVDDAGVLVMVSGVVFSNNNRKLDHKEFRGFALSDRHAPLVFVNGSDTKAGQMFTLAHELAHLWLDSTALSNASVGPKNGLRREEVWCNAVAAELLVPMADLRPLLNDDETTQAAVTRLGRYFKVSTLVILRRLLDAGWLNTSEFDAAWAMEKARLDAIMRGSGGDFYRTTISRVSRRFTQALVSSTLEGQTLYRDAFRMLGVAKTETFNQLGREVGVAL